VTVRVPANQAGNFRVEGQLVHFLGEDRANASEQSVSMPVQVSALTQTSEEKAGDPHASVRAPGFTLFLVVVAVGAIVLMAGSGAVNGDAGRAALSRYTLSSGTQPRYHAAYR